jgi:resuscitation-promoting factor RpfA
MNIEDDGLTPEERALEREFAQRLARLGPQREPSPALDARVLAAAHAAVQPRAKRRTPATWPTVFGLAASVVFALGLAWKLRPEPAEVASSQAASTAEEPLADYAPPPPAEVYAPRPKRVLEVPAPPPAEKPARTRGPGTSRPQPAPRKAPASEPPFAFEAMPAPVETTAAPPAPAAPQAAVAATAAGNSATAAQSAADAASTHREASDAAAPRAARDNVRTFEARKAAAPATATEHDVEFAEPDEEVVPPATADSPQVRDAWLQRIRELAKAGRLDDARASLSEFRHRYPGVVLPDDLRALGE